MNKVGLIVAPLPRGAKPGHGFEIHQPRVTGGARCNFVAEESRSYYPEWEDQRRAGSMAMELPE